MTDSQVEGARINEDSTLVRSPVGERSSAPEPPVRRAPCNPFERTQTDPEAVAPWAEDRRPKAGRRQERVDLTTEELELVCAMVADGAGLEQIRRTLRCGRSRWRRLRRDDRRLTAALESRELPTSITVTADHPAALLEPLRELLTAHRGEGVVAALGDLLRQLHGDEAAHRLLSQAALPADLPHLGDQDLGRVRDLVAVGKSEATVAAELGIAWRGRKSWQRLVEHDERLRAALWIGRGGEEDHHVERLRTSKGAPVGSIFALKARHGYRDTAPPAPPPEASRIFVNLAPMSEAQYSDWLEEKRRRQLEAGAAIEGDVVERQGPS